MSAKASLFVDKNHTALQPDEIFWRDIQPWLETKGYELRSRYKPGWTASWGEFEDPYTHEDGAPILVPHILDATRTSDGQMLFEGLQFMHHNHVAHRDYPMDPFPTDIYYIGNLIREDFLQRTRGVEFMLPLVVDMIHPDPSKRPTVDEVVRRFEEIRADLSIRTLRSRLVEKSERRHKMRAVVRDIQHFFMTVSYILHRQNPIPTPRD
ncbi:hypothetical protein ABKN59_011585 [Abortiporus biennis]